MRKLLLVLFLFLLFLPVFATPKIEFFTPEEQYYTYGKNITFKIYAIADTGNFITNDSTSCTIDVFNPENNSLILSSPLSFDGRYYSLNINQNSLKSRGEYNYIVLCNETTLVSADSDSFIVNGNGEKLNFTQFLIYAVLIALTSGIMALCLILMVVMWHFVSKIANFSFFWAFMLLAFFTIKTFLDSYLINFTFILTLLDTIFYILIRLTPFIYMIIMALIIIFLVANKNFKDNYAKYGKDKETASQEIKNPIIKFMWEHS